MGDGSGRRTGGTFDEGMAARQTRGMPLGGAGLSAGGGSFEAMRSQRVRRLDDPMHFGSGGSNLQNERHSSMNDNRGEGNNSLVGSSGQGPTRGFGAQQPSQGPTRDFETEQPSQSRRVHFADEQPEPRAKSDTATSTSDTMSRDTSTSDTKSRDSSTSDTKPHSSMSKICQCSICQIESNENQNQRKQSTQGIE